MSEFLISAYEWLVCLSEAVIAYLLFKSKFKCEKPRKFFALAALPVIASTTYLMNILELPWAVVATINCIIIISYVFLCFEGTPTLKCIWGVVPTIIYCISNFIFLIIFYVLTGYGSISLLPGNAVRIVGQLIYVILNFSALFPLLKIANENGELPVILRAGAVVVSLIGIAVSMYCFSTLVSPDAEKASASSWIQCFATLLLSIAFIFLSGYLSRLYRKQLEMQKDLQKTKLEAENVSQVSAMYDYVRSWRHDVKGMVSTISGLSQRGDYESVTKYLSELGAAAEETKVIVSTGNPAIDATISAKLMLANKRGISVTHSISIPENISLKATDVCSVIMNLLDNAIEASSEMPENERWMEFSLLKKKGMLTFIVSNSCKGKYEYSGEKLQTTKKDPSVHGIGLNRVDSIVKKYNGYLLMAPQTSTFKVTVLLPMEE